MTVGLLEMCEMLGFKIKSITGPRNDKKEIMYHGCRATIQSDYFTSPEGAQKDIYERLERMILDIIRVNRGLSNEDLVEIMFKKAQLNLMNDLNKLKEKQNE